MSERNLREASGELGSLREMLATIARCMESQVRGGWKGRVASEATFLCERNYCWSCLFLGDRVVRINLQPKRLELKGS